MKKLLSKISILAFIAVLGMGTMLSAQPVFAGYAFNTRSEDCDTTSVVNATTNEGFAQPCWTGKSVTVRPGETFNVKVYFRNTGDAGAENVYVRMTNAAGATVSAGQTKSYSGHILVGSSYAAGENVSVYFPSNVKIELQKIELQTTGSGITDISGDSSLFTSQGRKVANYIAPNLNDWGTVKASYRAVAVNDNTGSAPLVTTNDYSNLSSNNGSVTLNGSFVSNGLNTTTCFDYRNINSSQYIRVNETNRGNPSGSNTYSHVLSGLSSGTYEYRACAYNSAGSNVGQLKQFTIGNNVSQNYYQCNDGVDNDGDGRIDMNDAGCSSSNDDSENSDYVSPNVNNMTVSTSAANTNTNGTATLYGNYYNSNYYVSNMYFVYRRVGGSTITLPSAGSSGNASRGFSYVLSGLSSGTYEYQACADNGSNICGNWVSFSINRDTYVPPVTTNSNPTVQTLTPVSIGYTTAVIDAFYNMNGCSGRTYFEYGTSSNNLNQTTGSVSRSVSGSMAQALTGISSGVTYYYRPVVENCNGTVRGNVFSLTTARQGTTTVKSTTSTGTVKTTVVREVTNTNVVSGAAGTRYVRLTIDNSRDTVARGEELVYDVAWENIANNDIRDLVLEVTFPKALQITSTDRGQIDRDANAVYVNINELRVSEKDDITIRTKVVGNLKDNDSVTARAIIAFENPENQQAQENAIAYDSDSFVTGNNTVLGASIFGLNGFPGSLAGWLFLILLLILIILIIRYMTRREEHHHYYSRPADMPVAPTKSTTVIQEDVDYTPYRPTPKE